MVAWTHPFQVLPVAKCLEFSEQPYTLPTVVDPPVWGQWFLSLFEVTWGLHKIMCYRVCLRRERAKESGQAECGLCP